MTNKNNVFKWIDELLIKIESDLKRVRILLNEISNNSNISNNLNDENIYDDIESIAWKLLNYDDWNEIKVVEWVYDWYFMTWSDWKKYPVPMNYSSKTKLVPWDVLKLRIMEDWRLVYKLISASPRKFIKATLSKTDDSKFIAISDDWRNYILNQAAVTYFKWKPWDELSIIINSNNIWEYAAIEAVLSK